MKYSFTVTKKFQYIINLKNIATDAPIPKHAYSLLWCLKPQMYVTPFSDAAFPLWAQNIQKDWSLKLIFKTKNLNLFLMHKKSKYIHQCTNFESTWLSADQNINCQFNTIYIHNLNEFSKGLATHTIPQVTWWRERHAPRHWVWFQLKIKDINYFLFRSVQSL